MSATNKRSRRFSLRKLLRMISFLFSLLLTAWFVAVQAGCLAMRTPDREWPEKLQKAGQTLPPQFLDVPDPDGRMIHAVSVAAADSLPWVVMVHGSPGSADAYLPYLADTVLTRHARVLSIDRPGFGYTQDFGCPEGSLEKQAASVRAVVDRVAPQQKVWLVGHSLGGPVIARFAMDYPEQTAGLVLVAASVDPEQEKHPWWQAAIDPWPLKWLIPKSLWTSNAEIIPLESELKKMLPLWERIRCPVRVLHATDDRLVPVANTDFIRRMVSGTTDLKMEIYPEGDHFILWSKPAQVRQSLVELIENN